MIPVKCPHCQVGLKVDEKKVPEGLNFFKCPKCKQNVPLSLLENIREHLPGETDTVVLQPSNKEGGKLTVFPDTKTNEQIFHLREGQYVVGRKASVSNANIRIETEDRMISRNHFRINVKKDAQGGLLHCLSDLQSKNRTMYNNRFLEEDEEVVLQDNDEIKIGHTLIRFNFNQVQTP
jgi:pSer/pThr/pTyr-binding forkhead associated (FHA) protein